MPPKWFKCPNGQHIEIEACLKPMGCIMGDRCAPLPYLQMVGHERPYNGVTASMSGNGPRYIYLAATVPYTVDPAESAYAFMGTLNHLKVAQHDDNVIAEENVGIGTLDLLSDDETNPGHYLIEDYKTYGSYRAARVLGIVCDEKPVIGDDGNPVLLKSGKNKGKPKMEKVFRRDPASADIYGEQLQLSRYAIEDEKRCFPISRLMLFIVPRDGGTFVSQTRGITEKIYYIEIPRMSNQEVCHYYDTLQVEVDNAFKTGYARICNSWESWEYRRCKGFCPVSKECEAMTVKGDIDRN